MRQFTWEQMTLCKECECHYADKDNPSICHYGDEESVKPFPMIDMENCSRYLRESKWQRMPESEKQLV